MRTYGVGLVALAALALTGCGGGDAQPEAAPVETASSAPVETPTSEEPTPEEATPEEAEVDCADVSAELLTTIGGLPAEGSGFTPLRGAAYRSPDFAEVYFVAVEFSATGVPDQVGVWATNSLEPDAAVFSADGYAKQFTTWPASDVPAAGISGFDPGIQVAGGCLA